MHALVANELLKLRTTRAHIYLLAAQLAVVAAAVAGVVVSGKDLQSPGAERVLLAHVGPSFIFALVLGITAVAGEYRDGTIIDTFLATPRRERVYAAKLVAFAGVGLVVGILSAATAVAVAAVAYAMDGSALNLGAPDVWQTLLGGIAFIALCCVCGVAVGALIPNIGASVATALAWTALVEVTMYSLVGDLSRWLPIASGFALNNTPQMNMLSQSLGGLVFTGYAVALTALGAVAIVRRDVS
jgi:ABC-2 type transport system permease protein